MDNDIKIKKSAAENQRHKDVTLFLKDQLSRLQEDSSVSTYNLEEEYAKTKKNKNVFVWLMLCSSFLIVGLAAFFISRNISHNNREISVSVNVFDDLNLKNLMNNVQKVQENYENAVKSKSVIQTKYEFELRQAQFKRDNGLFVIKSMNLDNKIEEDKRNQAVLEDYTKEVLQIQNTYEPELSAADAEIEVLREQLARFDSDKVRAAKESELAVNSERQLKELENRELSEKYEKRISELETVLVQERASSQRELKDSITEVATKYQKEIDTLDPKLAEENVKLIAQANSIERMSFNQNAASGGVADSSLMEDNAAMNALNSFQQTYNEFSDIHSVVRSIPQKYSIPLYTKAESALVNKMGMTLVDAAKTMHDEKVAMQNQYDELNDQFQAYKVSAADGKKQYYNILDVMLAEKKWNGIVLSSENSSAISVYVRSDAVASLFQNNSASAEIVKAGKGTINIVEKNVYEFVPDASGFNLSHAVPGTQIRIFSK